MAKQITILLIEDDQDDIELLQDAFKDNAISISLEVLMQGDKIISWFDTCTVLPDIIVLDLNLPKLHGREVLLKIKDQERYKNIPLIILTTSSYKEDIKFCLDHGADQFITKPFTSEGFTDLVNTIKTTAFNKANSAVN